MMQTWIVAHLKRVRVIKKSGDTDPQSGVVGMNKIRPFSI